MKLAIIYDSKTDNTRQAAAWIAEGMNKVKNVEAKIFHISDIDYTFVNQTKGIVIGSPVYATQMTADMRTWLLNAAMRLNVAGKLGGAFATAQYTHGGAELVIQTILTNEIAFGMLAYSGGASKGLPVIHLGPVGVNGNVEPHNKMENYRDNFVIYGKRFADKAVELFKD